MKTTAKLSFMMFVEWFIWGAWFVPLWLWLSKSGFSAGPFYLALTFRQQRRDARHHWRIINIFLRHAERFRVMFATGAA